mgnify:CR=1 FL=1
MNFCAERSEKLDNHLCRMVLPSQKRPGKWREGILQVRVTGKCERACPHCSEIANTVFYGSDLTVEEAEKAFWSLRDYWGVVGVFGGNPTLHPNFDKICESMRKWIPYEQRGIWTSGLGRWGKVCRETFNPGVSVLNPHGSLQQFLKFKTEWPRSRPFSYKDLSCHCAPFVAMSDLIDDEETRWGLIETCEINQHWSAMICKVRGELVGWFCEVAGSMSILHEEDENWPSLGMPIEDKWWKRGWWDGPKGRRFADQAVWCCHRCGIPLKCFSLKDDFNEYNVVSPSHFDWFEPKKGVVKMCRSRDDLECSDTVIRYLKEGKRVSG